jgi:hypothetical protein
MTNASLFKVEGTLDVVRELLECVVHRPVDLEHQAQLGAVEVYDVTADNLLAAKLQAQAPSCSKQLPRSLLGIGRLSAQLTSETQLVA